MNVLFDEWIMRTRQLQREAYGRDPALLEGDERADYFRSNVAALVFELGEASNGIGWKNWGTDRTLSRDEYIGELIDAAHFLGNLFAIAGVTDAELNELYLAKMAKNRARQAAAEAYDGRVAGKCPTCRRAYDDVAVGCFEGIGSASDYCEKAAREEVA